MKRKQHLLMHLLNRLTTEYNSKIIVARNVWLRINKVVKLFRPDMNCPYLFQNLDLLSSFSSLNKSYFILSYMAFIWPDAHRTAGHEEFAVLAFLSVDFLLKVLFLDQILLEQPLV